MTEPEQAELWELWTALLSCGHWQWPIGTGGVPYGRPRVGQWISCITKPGTPHCQTQRKVIRVERFG